MLGHPGHGQRVERLQGEGGDAGHQQRRVAVDAPRHAVGAEPARVAHLRGVDGAGARAGAELRHGAEDRAGDEGRGDGAEHAAADAAEQLRAGRGGRHPLGLGSPHPGGRGVDALGPGGGLA